MRLRRPLAAAAWVALLATPAGAPVVRADLVLPRVSPAAKVSQTIGTTELSLAYSRPGVKSRRIWGGLVPYDSLWRTGANEPTSLATTDDIMVAGRRLAAGKYAIVTLPRPGEWAVAFSTQTDLQGTGNYDPKQEVLRVTAAPDTTQPNQEWMWLGFDDLTPTSCNLVLRWERLRLAIPIAVDVNAVVLAGARKEIAAAKSDDWRTPHRAAAWCFDNAVALDEAAGWLEKSLAVQATHANLALKARWLAKDGKKSEAVATATKAIEAGKASKPPVDTTATEKLVAEWTGKK
jgi:hypothetical protein